MQPGAPGLPPNTSRGTTMSEATPSTPDEGRVHGVPSFGGRETAAVPGTAPHHERQKKTANAPQWRRDIVRKVGSYTRNFAPRTPRSQGRPGAFIVSGIREAKRDMDRPPMPRFVLLRRPELFGEVHPGRLRSLGTRQIDVGPGLLASQLGRQQLGKATDIGIVAVHRLVVVLARHRHAVLRPLGLVLQGPQILFLLHLRLLLPL